jgi:hypothetical protein
VIEMDIFQGDSEYIVDDEYLGTLRVPAGAAGRKIDFKLDSECLLTVVVDLPDGAKQIELATRDTPETLRRALEEDAGGARPRRSCAPTPSRGAPRRPARLHQAILGRQLAPPAISQRRLPPKRPGGFGSKGEAKRRTDDGVPAYEASPAPDEDAAKNEKEFARMPVFPSLEWCQALVDAIHSEPDSRKPARAWSPTSRGRPARGALAEPFIVYGKAGGQGGGSCASSRTSTRSRR